MDESYEIVNETDILILDGGCVKLSGSRRRVNPQAEEPSMTHAEFKIEKENRIRAYILEEELRRAHIVAGA